MARQKLDFDKLRSALRRLRKQELLDLLDDALDLIPKTKLEALVEDYVDLDKIRPTSPGKGQLLAEVKRFEMSSLDGNYFESFRVKFEKLPGYVGWHRSLDRRVQPPARPLCGSIGSR